MPLSGAALIAVMVGGCGAVDHSTMPEIDGSVDAPPPPMTDAPRGCDPRAAFGMPQLVQGFDPTRAPADVSLSPDELTIYLTMTSPTGDRDVYVATRTSRSAAFGNPTQLTALRSTAEDACPSVSADGLTLAFQSRRVAGEGAHLYVATRPSTIAAFGAPGLIANVASPVATADDLEPIFTADGSELWFISVRTGSRDIFRAQRTAGGYGNPVPVAELTTMDGELHAMVSADRLTAFFASNRAGGLGGFDIYRAHRTTVDDGFGAPVLVPELNTTADDFPRWLSPDNCRLYLHSSATGSLQIYVATRTQ